MNAHISPLTIQEHADHSSLEITSIYANHKSKEVTDDIRKNSPISIRFLSIPIPLPYIHYL